MRAGLLGYPITHSVSPDIFAALARTFKVPLTYDLIEIHPQEFSSFIKDFNFAHLLGMNITIPYKEKMIQYLDQADNSVLETGSVNVLKISNGKKMGFNTDIYGISKSLSEAQVNLKESDCVIFGSGGAARSAIYVLSKKQARTITVVARNTVAVNKLKDTFPHIISKPFSQSNIQADLYINATPLGTKNSFENQSPYIGLFKENSTVFDMVYRPQQTLLIQSAVKQNIKIIPGLNMLIHQALKSWEIWFEQDVSDLFDQVLQVIPGESV